MSLEARRRDVLDATRAAHEAAQAYELAAGAQLDDADHLRRARSTTDHLAVAEALLMSVPWAQAPTEQEATR